MDEDTRFRRALNNPFVMMGLCLIAGIVVYINVLEPEMNTSVTSSMAFNPSSPEKNPVPEGTAQQAYEKEATQWIDNPDRDPFAPVKVATLVKSFTPPSTISAPATHVKRRKKREEPPPRLILKAVALEAHQRSAVINRRMVYEGEMIEGYRVVSIQLAGVWLTRHGEKQFLTFAKNTAS